MHPPYRALPAFATAAAALLLVAALAYWGWYWASPPPALRTVPAASDPVAVIVASGLMGGGGSTNEAIAPATLAGDVRLLGTFAQADGKGYALFRMASGPRLVAVDGDIASGAVLAAVSRDGITVREGGSERSIALRTATSQSTATLPAGAQPRVAHRPAACTPPAGFHGPMMKLNAELLQGLLLQPDALRAIVEPADGGMTVRDDSGFAALLGLKRGDRVRLANGIPLANADDVIAAVVKPLVANQQVRLSGTRGGLSQEMLLLNAGACP